MTEPLPLFDILRNSADTSISDAIEREVREAPDRNLNRVNCLEFARRESLDEERTITAFLHASRLGIFELSWNVLCPGCGGRARCGGQSEGDPAALLQLRALRRRL